MHEDDYVLKDLKYLESCGSNWTTRAKQVNKILSSTEALRIGIWFSTVPILVLSVVKNGIYS